MADAKIAALNPTVRRALRQPTVSPSTGNAADGLDPAGDLCLRCHDTGLVPADGGGVPVLGPCPHCRTGALGLCVAQIAAGKWIAVRDLPDLWGTGPSPVDALLDLERRTPESVSAFSRTYLREAAAVEAGQNRRVQASGQVA